jgi:hypothetical protein
MNRIEQQASLPIPSWRASALGALKYSAVAAGALILAIASLAPPAGAPWTVNVRPPAGLFTGLRMSSFILDHPPSAILLTSLAALLLLVGLELPDPQRLTNDARPTR